MKKIFLSVIILASVILLSSCYSSNFLPQATNSAGSVAFGELNLNRNEYLVFKTISESATVIYNVKDNEVKEKNNEFSYEFGYDKTGKVVLNDVDGVIRLGSLSNMASNYYDPTNVGDITRRLAIFRLNNSAKEAGADYIIEPIVSMDIKETGRNEVTFTATATAKLVRIKKTDD
ncbi:MAG: hypothetical protein IJK85_01140 [Bacteroidales bacterium]|nr:hypothetical protein [Bacteroidales bacterium]